MPSSACAVLLTALEALGVALRAQEGRLVWDWPAPAADDGSVIPEVEARFETLMAELRTRKVEALEIIEARTSGRPYLLDDCLVVPFGAPERYRWWAAESCALGLHGVLLELRADPRVHRAYCGPLCERDGRAEPAFELDEDVPHQEEHGHEQAQPVWFEADEEVPAAPAPLPHSVDPTT